MQPLSHRVLYYGKDEALPERHLLHAGPLTLVFEVGDLRYIRFGDCEVLRRVYVAVRDYNWDTVPGVISELRMETTTTDFRITYDVRHKERDIDFAWKAVITGDADGRVRFEMDGEARSTFLRNRIGFCVLHPIRECAGQPCRVEKVDGTVQTDVFPRYISPHQPFFDMAAIAHQVAPGVEAEVRFQGDIFEMEDQRNWTDASYKTYCTPLREPYPVEIKQGTKVSQAVTLTLKTTGQPPSSHQLPASSRQQNFLAGGWRLAAGGSMDAITLTASSSAAVALPRIGLGMASHGQPLSIQEQERLKALNLSHLRVDLRLSDTGAEAVLARATREAQALGVSLEAALFLTDDGTRELENFAKLLAAVNPPVDSFLIFHENEKSTSAKWIDAARRYLPPHASIGSGTNAYFTELNRERPPAEKLDAVCYSLNPQVHAFDNASLVEALEAQASTVESARQFVGEKPLLITPVTLKPRFNPNATGPEAQPAVGELPPQVDARQMSLFGAGWTLGSVKYLSEAGVSSITFYETTGWRGVMETETGSGAPSFIPKAVFPLYHILADVGDFAGGEVVPTVSNQPLQVDGLMLRKGGRTRVLLANFCDAPVSVSVQGLDAQVCVCYLDETNVLTAMQSPEAFRSQPGEKLATEAGILKLDLRPYAVARIDNV